MYKTVEITSKEENSSGREPETLSGVSESVYAQLPHSGDRIRMVALPEAGSVCFAGLWNPEPLLGTEGSPTSSKGKHGGGPSADKLRGCGQENVVL